MSDLTVRSGRVRAIAAALIALAAAGPSASASATPPASAASAPLTIQAASPGASPAPRIEGGTLATATDVPTAVRLSIQPSSSCTGTLIGPRHVITAAHCVMKPATGVVAPSAITVGAGYDHVSGTTLIVNQVLSVSAVRVHPRYVPDPNGYGRPYDIADLTLASDAVAGPTVQFAALPGAPAPTDEEQHVIPGYGTQASGWDYKPRTLAFSLVPREVCNEDDGAVTRCFTTQSGSICPGDSGSGVLVQRGATRVLVGVARSVELPCHAGGLGRYTDVTAPSIRAFVDGAALPPEAPIHTSPGGISSRGLTATCDPGGWSGGPTIEYGFRSAGSGTPLTFGASATFRGVAGQSVECVVRVSTAGGTTLDTIASTPALTPLQPTLTLAPQGDTIGYSYGDASAGAPLRAQVSHDGITDPAVALSGAGGTFAAPTRPGHYTICLLADAAGDYAAGSVCTPYLHGGAAGDALTAEWTKRTGRVRRVRLTSSLPQGQPVRVIWRASACKRCKVRVAHTSLTVVGTRSVASPRTRRGWRVTALVTMPAFTTNDGIPFTAGSRLLK